jgi:hypothetical protein
MPKVADNELIQIGAFAGLDNVRAEFAATLGGEPGGPRVAPLRVAENVDIDTAGKLRSRKGWARLLAAANARGLWSVDRLGWGLVAFHDELHRVHADGSTQAVVSGIDPNAAPCYAEVNGVAYWSDGQRIGRVFDDGSVAGVWCEQPAGQPMVSSHAAGGLTAGLYQVAITFENLRGEESGSSMAVEVDVQEGQGIRLSAIPQPVEAGTRVNVFVTAANGEELYWRAVVPWGMTEYLIGAGAQGRKLETQFMSLMPAGQMMAAAHGRLFVFSGASLWYSEPLRYGLTRRAANWVQYVGPPTLLLPVGSAEAGAGLYVAAGQRTYWHAGADPRTWQRVIAYPHGAVFGTGMVAPGSYFGLETTQQVGYWLASNGAFCTGSPGGAVSPFSEGTVIADPADAGASLLREVDGIRQALTVTRGNKVGRFGLRDSASVRVFRNGVEI